MENHGKSLFNGKTHYKWLTRLAIGRTGASNGTGWEQHAAKPLVEAIYIQYLLRLTLCCRWQRALFDSFPARLRREGDRI